MSVNSGDYASIWTYLCQLGFTQGYVEAGGIRTRYVQAGPKDAPALVMVHGMGGSWENCFGNLPAHAAHFNTFALDLVGHGFSGKPDKVFEIADYVAHLKGFLDAMGIERTSFIGVSLGSWVTTKFTTLYPERVDKVTMVSAWGRPRAGANVQIAEESEEVKQGKAARLAAVANPTWPAMEAVFAGLIKEPQKRLPDLLAVRQAIYRQPEMKQAMANILGGIDPKIWARNALTDREVSGIRKPYLIFASIDSKDEFLESSYAYQKLIPNARLIEMTGAWHWPQWERVDEFNRRNLEFLLAP
ncbi:MAG: alpha/beta fold hydrolase [Reyranellaceae bacterium]